MYEPETGTDLEETSKPRLPVTQRNATGDSSAQDCSDSPNERGESQHKENMLMQTQEAPRNVESVAAAGNQVMETVKNLIHEGNVRRISIKQEGRTIAEFPLTFGVVGAALAPVLAAAGAIAALVTDCTIEIERDENSSTGVGG